MTKQGPWTYEEKTFIKNQSGKLTPDEIANKLDRSLRGVRTYLNKEVLMKNYTSSQLVEKDDFQNITKTHYWEELKSQFDVVELESFKYHWANVIKQFRDDIFHTEELQIIDMIKLEILSNRLLTQQTDIKKKIRTYEKIVEDEKMKPKELRDIDMVRNYEVQIASLYVGVESLSKEYRELLKEKNNMFKALKATREQRIKDIENSKESMAGWYRKLLKEPEIRKDMGLYLEKMRIATQVEYERLVDVHTYADGSKDSVLLIPEEQ